MELKEPCFFSWRSVSGLIWRSKFQYTVHARKTRKTVSLHGELVDSFFGLGGVEFGQRDLYGRIVLKLDDILTSGFTEGLLDFNLSGGRHVALQVCVLDLAQRAHPEGQGDRATSHCHA